MREAARCWMPCVRDASSCFAAVCQTFSRFYTLCQRYPRPNEKAAPCSGAAISVKFAENQLRGIRTPLIEWMMPFEFMMSALST